MAKGNDHNYFVYLGNSGATIPSDSFYPLSIKFWLFLIQRLVCKANIALLGLQNAR